MDESALKSLHSRNSTINTDHKEKKQIKPKTHHKHRHNSKTNDLLKLHFKEKQLFNNTILRKKQKYVTTLSTTRDNTLTSENSKKDNYYEKFINGRHSDLSEEEMKNKLDEENYEDMQFLNNILYDIKNNIDINEIISENNSIYSESNYTNIRDIKRKENKSDFDKFRRYIIKLQKKFKIEMETKLNPNTYNQNFALSCYCLKKLENLISRFGLIIFFLIQMNKPDKAKNIFLLMLRENYTYIDNIENSIINWYSISKRRINMSKEFPKMTYQLIKMYSFIIKYTQYFNMMNYCNIFLCRYFDIIHFIFNFFIYKSNIRGFTLDTKNQINFWFSFALHNVSYYSILYYFPLNISINLNNYIINLYKNSDENNLTSEEKILIIKTFYNLGLYYYLNGQNDRSLSNLNDAKDIILNSNDNEIYKSNVIQPVIKKKESISLVPRNFKIKNTDFNIEKEQLRLSIGTAISDNITFNNNNDNKNIKISINTIKEAYLKDKISLEDIKLLINYGIKAGLMTENNSGQFNNIIHISPTDISPKYRFKYLSIPKYFNNPLLRKIELLMSEIELDRKNYNSSYDHVLKTFYILLSLKLNKKGNELIMFNSEQKIIQKYMELISTLKDKENRLNTQGKSEVNTTLLNQSLATNNNDSFMDNNYNQDLSDKMLDKYNINININTNKENKDKKKYGKQILIYGQKFQNFKISKELEKFFIFLNKLSLYQIKILNESQPDNNKRNDLPILFSSQFKDSLSYRQRIELDNLQTMALSRFIVLKNANKWIMPNNLNIGIIDEKKIKNYLKKRTIRFLNKYCESNNSNNVPIRKTKEYKYFQEILKSEKCNKELKKFFNNNFDSVIKILKKVDEDEIKNIINSPKIIVEPVQKYIKKRKKELKKNKSSRGKERENDYRFNNINNYDFDENYENNRHSSRGRVRTMSTKIKNFKNKLYLSKQLPENSVDDFYQKLFYKKGNRNNSVLINNNLLNENKDKKDYNDSYEDFQISIEEDLANN